jgi:glutathione S-transferase
MDIYGVPLSPFVRKVHLVAAEKGITIQMKHGDPRNPSPEFLAASPFQKIPAMVDGDFGLADSTAIAMYIEAKHPEPALYPAAPKERGKAVWFEEFADTILAPSGGKVIFNRFIGPKVIGIPGDEAVAALGEAELLPQLAYLESVAPAEGWLAGTDFSIADIAVATMLRTLNYVGLCPTAESYPAISGWYERVCARPAWQQVAALEEGIAARFAG